MSKIKPFFPLNLVAFPGQKLHLHVFEPRYVELIEDCMENDSTFVIPSYVKNKIEYGTEMSITSIEKKYSDGRYDVKTMGERIIRVLNMENPYGNKKYAAGEVEELKDRNNGDIMLREEIYNSVKELYLLAEIQKDRLRSDFRVFDVAHQVGLSKDAEYELIQLEEERQRQRFLLDHLKVIIPKLRDIQKSKERIQMNGHFRKYDPLDF